MIEAHRTSASHRNTSLSSLEFHPRHRFGKWAQAGVPHTGWQCLFINDLGEQDHTCEMCELQQVRYVHHMRHPDYPKVLEVGCECAADMEQSHESATRRVRSMKNRAERRDNWLTRKWRVSANDNPWLKMQGRRVVIRRRGRVGHLPLHVTTLHPTTRPQRSRQAMQPSWRHSISSGLLSPESLSAWTVPVWVDICRLHRSNPKNWKSGREDQ